MSLDELRAVVESIAQDVPTRELGAAFDRIATSYTGDERRTPVSSTTDAIAYALGRGFGTFASVERALHAVAIVRPDWHPRSLLDVGAGTGSASWAAASVFDSIERVTLVERSEAMMQLGGRVAAFGPPAVRNATWITADAVRPTDDDHFDLVLASFVLGELAVSERDDAVARWFAATDGELVIVEPGSVPGFEVIRAARDQLIATGATISAPCPHDGTCPMTDGDWCHFGVRVQRSRLQRRVTSADRGFEDEKYSYVVASKQGRGARSSRILRRPERREGHVRLRLCAESGIDELVVAKRDAERYRQARKAGWGDRFPDVDAV